MSTLRSIREEERTIVLAMLNQAKSELSVSDQVTEYGDPFMGSINFDNNRPNLYAGDIVACQYTDTDGQKVVLTLTKDTNGNLLDLDFWKENFTPLVKYPTPNDVKFG